MAALPGIASELVGVGRVALAHELLQPVLMDPVCVLRRQADTSDEVQAVQQLTDVVGLGRDRHGLEPGERRHPDRGVDDEQPIQPGEVVVRQPGD